VVAAYTSFTVFYDSLHVSYERLSREILGRCARVDSAGETPVGREHRIPVEYRGPDLDNVASAVGLTAEAVIEIHSARWYSVDLLGFVPGWAFMSELDERLELPRRPQPHFVASRLARLPPWPYRAHVHESGRGARRIQRKVPGGDLVLPVRAPGK